MGPGASGPSTRLGGIPRGVHGIPSRRPDMPSRRPSETSTPDEHLIAVVCFPRGSPQHRRARRDAHPDNCLPGGTGNPYPSGPHHRRSRCSHGRTTRTRRPTSGHIRRCSARVFAASLAGNRPGRAGEPISLARRAHRSPTTTRRQPDRARAATEPRCSRSLHGHRPRPTPARVRHIHHDAKRATAPDDAVPPCNPER